MTKIEFLRYSDFEFFAHIHLISIERSNIVTNHWVWHGRKVGPSPGIPGSPVPQDTMDHRNTQHLWTLVAPGISGPQDSWKITSTFWNSESKHPETLKHKQRTFVNYIIEQSKRKIACTFWGCFIYRVVINDY